MSPFERTHRYIVDPSMVLSEAWLSWLEEEQDEEAIAEVAVSRAFVGYLREVRERVFFPWLPEDHQEDYSLYRERALALLEERVELFDYEQADLPDELRAVQVSLLETGDPDARILADEWAFLQSQSWMLSATRTSVAALRRHGAWVVQFGGHWSRAMAKKVIEEENIPPRFTPGFLARVGAKWVVWGTATTGAGVGGFVAGTAIAGPLGGAAGGTLGALLAEEGLQAALLEFDP